MKKTQGINNLSDLIHHYGIITPFFTGLFTWAFIILIVYTGISITEAIKVKLQDKTFKQKVEKILNIMALSIMSLFAIFFAGYLILDTFK
jgi:hypothetical protein